MAITIHAHTGIPAASVLPPTDAPVALEGLGVGTDELGDGDGMVGVGVGTGGEQGTVSEATNSLTVPVQLLALIFRYLEMRGGSGHGKKYGTRDSGHPVALKYVKQTVS